MKSKPFTIEDLARKGFVADKDGTFICHGPIMRHTYKLSGKNNLKSEDVKIKKTSRPKASIPKPDPEGLQAIKRVLMASGVKYETEYRFDEERRFRFDIAIVDKMVAIEYEGLMSTKSRHTTIKGYNNDTIKYNLAIIRGWKVLRYTTMSYKNFVEDIKYFL